MQQLLGRNILVGVSAGIAAYKTAELVRRLRVHGATVRVVMTQHAQAFVTPLTFQALSGNSVATNLFDPTYEAAMGHIELARWADLFIVAPASANVIARLAQGMADDLLTTLALATAAPLLLAPAMNRLMWQHPAVQANIETLKQRGVNTVGPDQGEQACGEVGIGRMTEVVNIVATVLQYFETSGRLTGKRVLITAGPTCEAIDPIRYLTNRSSGKMGYALAQVAELEGAQVTLVSGPVTLVVPQGVNVITVKTAAEMHQAVMAEVERVDVVIAAAAVADYKPESSQTHKLKKQEQSFTLKLERTRDILQDIAALSVKPKVIVGFAAETENLLENAKQKLNNKKLSMIVANHVLEAGSFASDDNEVTILLNTGEQVVVPKQSKQQLAQVIIKTMSRLLD